MPALDQIFVELLQTEHMIVFGYWHLLNAVNSGAINNSKEGVSSM